MDCDLLVLEMRISVFCQFQAFLFCLQIDKINFQDRRAQLPWQCFNALQFSSNQPLFIIYLRHSAASKTAWTEAQASFKEHW